MRIDRRTKLRNKRILLAGDESVRAGAEVLGPARRVADALHLVEAAAADGGTGAAVLDINTNGRHVSPAAGRLAALGVPFLFATGYGAGRETSGHDTAPVLESRSTRRRWSPPSRPSRRSAAPRGRH